MIRRARPALLPGAAALLATLLAACAHAPGRRAGPAAQAIPPHDNAALLRTPDAIPRIEPRSPYGNPPVYTVYGHRYVVLASADGYLARGVASWYGPTFQGQRTSNGETYDMFGMTAAHKTLPLPCYARVTNLANGRSVVVRINDRGPFIGDRLIDLSYTAALKLDMIRTGTAWVEVRTLNPAAPLAPAVPALPATPAPAAPASPAAPLPTAAPWQAPPLTARNGAGNEAGVAAAPRVRLLTAGDAIPADSIQTVSRFALDNANQVVPTATSAAAAPPPGTTAPSGARPIYIQVGAYASSDNARRTAHRLRAAGLEQVFTLLPPAGQSLLRVRIGPLADLREFDTLMARLAQLGFSDARLAQE